VFVVAVYGHECKDFKLSASDQSVIDMMKHYLHTSRKMECSDNKLVDNKNNMTGASSETGTFSSLSKCTLLFRVSTIFGYSFHSICLDFFLFCGSLYIFFLMLFVSFTYSLEKF
jgi:hypothetical protein